VMQPMHSPSQKQERTPPSTQYTGYLTEQIWSHAKTRRRKENSA
jgi:hypothetical protein